MKFFLKNNELVQAVGLARLLLGLFPSDSIGFPAGRAELVTLIPQLQASSACPLTLAGDDPPGGIRAMDRGRRSAAQDF